MWKKIIIDGQETNYSVSDEGQVRNDKRNNFLSQHQQNGYLHTTIQINGKSKRISVHRLVCIAFHENPLNKTTVNHINGVKTDNRAENLEWTTVQENTQHAWDTGLAQSVVACKIVQYSLDGKRIASFDSQVEAAKKTGSNDTNISMCCTGKRLSHNGFQWRYEGDAPKKLKVYSPPNSNVRVGQYDADGELVAEYPSIRQAALAVEGTPSAISRVLSGTRQTKTHKGFAWKYIG